MRDASGVAWSLSGPRARRSGQSAGRAGADAAKIVQGRKARRPANQVSQQVLVGGEPQDGKTARDRRSSKRADAGRRSDRMRCDFRSWHEADLKRCPLKGRYREESGHDADSPFRQLLTRIGHWAEFFFIVSV